PSFAKALPPAVRIEQGEPIELDAIYFDTDDHRLVRSGVTLRRRRGGDDAGWHLKVPEANRHTRLEIRRPLGAGTLTEVPSELADFVLARTRGKPLRQVAEIRTTRTVSKVVGSGSDPLALVADDVVEGHPVGGAADRAWREIEVEVEPDGARVAKRIGKVL